MRMMFFSTIIYFIVASYPIANVSAVNISLDTTAIDTLRIEPVEVHGSAAKFADLALLEADYRKLLAKNMNANFLSGVVITPVSIGLSFDISSLYSKLSKSGKSESRRFNWLKVEILERKLDDVWFSMTNKYSSLDSINIKYYQIYYRPGASEFLTLSEAEQLNYLIFTLKNYKDSVNIIKEIVSLPQ